MKYKIQIEGTYIEVPEELYREYKKMERRERYLLERDRQNGVMSYNALDNENISGVELFPDGNADIEEILVLMEERKMLYMALATLKEEDKELVEELYFKGKTEQELAEKLGIRQPNVHKRKCRILKELKKKIIIFQEEGY